MSTAEAIKELTDEQNRIDPETAFVEVHNLNDDYYDFKWNSKHFIVPPGESRSISYFNMVHYCGDPRSFNHPTDPRRKFRAQEWTRLRTLYGVYEHTSDEAHMSQIPKFEVFSPSGIKITTVLDDPEGNNTEMGAPVTELESRMADVTRLQAMLEEKMKQVDAIIERNEKQAAPVADNEHRTEQPLVTPDIPQLPDVPVPAMSAEDLTSTRIPTKKASSRA